MTPGFTIDNLCKALGVHRNYSFLPLYSFLVPLYDIFNFVIQGELPRRTFGALWGT